MFKAMERTSVADYSPQVNESYTAGLPPPAYPKQMPTSLKLARILSGTILVLTLLMGIFILIGIYIQTNSASCNCDTDAASPMETRRVDQSHYEPLTAMASDTKPVRQVPLPLKLQLDQNVEHLMDKNKKAHINCVVEKRRATQVIANKPKMMITPYGNITSDPGVMQMVGEKMIFSCQTGMKRSPAKDKGDRGTRRRRSAAGGACDCNCAC